MIHKSGYDKLSWLDDAKTSRTASNTSARSSFEKVLLATASAMLKEGKSIEDIATTFNMSVDSLTYLMTPPADEPQISKTASVNEAPATKDAADSAYDAMYGRKSQIPENYLSTTSSTIHSAMGNQSVSDVGGPKKYLGHDSSNSIWDSEKISRLIKQEDNGMRIKAENAAIKKRHEDIKNASRNQTIDGQSLVDAIKNTETRSDSNIQSISAQEGSGYKNKIASNDMSIFDNAKFDRLDEKTAGEKLADDNKKRAAERKSQKWIPENKQVTSRGIFDRMIESMTADKQEKSK